MTGQMLFKKERKAPFLYGIQRRLKKFYFLFYKKGRQQKIKIS